MSTEILINRSLHETRIAAVDNGSLQEVLVERDHNRGLVGNIYKGKVVRVLPGMQAAFVDVGLERAGFLHVNDLQPQAGTDDDESVLIQERVHEGMPLVVQVAKDPIGSKGARLTCQLSLSSRYLVYMPLGDRIGVSQKIEDADERERLRDRVDAARASLGGSGSFIVRTAAEAAEAAELRADMTFLLRLWDSVDSQRAAVTAPGVVYQDLPLALRALRDQVRGPVEAIRVDDAAVLLELRAFAEKLVPETVGLIEPYTGDRPLFDLYSIEEEIERALLPRVDLKSGGYLVVEQTEAMTTVDVNTGGFVGHRNLEETIFKTNLEAASALARQLRLRNLGGIIIIDFIDMRDAEHRRQVLRTLEKALARDPVKTAITGVTDLGLVQVTRKRTRESLEQALSEACPVCEGRGRLKTPETICYAIYREVLRAAETYENDTLLILASQAVVDRLLDEESANVADLEYTVRRTLRFQVEPIYNQEQFDVVPL